MTTFLLFFVLTSDLSIKDFIDHTNYSYFKSEIMAEVYIWANWENAEPKLPFRISLRCNGRFKEYPSIAAVNTQELPMLIASRYGAYSAEKILAIPKNQIYFDINSKTDLYLWVLMLRKNGYSISWQKEAIQLYLK